MTYPLLDELDKDKLNEILDLMQPVIERIQTLAVEQQVEALNQVREMLHQAGPFADEPIDLVQWRKSEQISPNDYNPGVIYRPERRLLNKSVTEWHFTQPLVTTQEYELIGGEKRYELGQSSKIAKRLHGYLPVTVVSVAGREEQMACSVQHHRACGTTDLEKMVFIVRTMLEAGWQDDEVASALGMDADELLRMKQVSLAAGYTDRDFNRGWVRDGGQSEVP